MIAFTTWPVVRPVLFILCVKMVDMSTYAAGPTPSP